MAQINSKQNIQSALAAFQTGNLSQNAIALFDALDYNTIRQQPFEQNTYAYFKEYYVSDNSNFNAEKAKVTQWQSIDLLFQLSKGEVSDQQNVFGTHQVEQTIIESYLFFALELKPAAYSRTDLAQITREINKVFSMPAMILFKHGDSITLSVINRRLHKTNAQKDVLEKVILIKDIAIENPHRAHIDILSDLSFSEIKRVNKVSNFVELHNAWQKILDTKQLNKKFYKELSNWYFWAIKKVYFPSNTAEEQDGGIFAQDDKVQEHNAKNLIRLLTRLLFVWFIKEKALIPDELFDETYIREHLITDFAPKKDENLSTQKQHSKYYRAILQNLFFATLNQTAGKREFRKDKQHRNVTNLMRYESYFKDPQVFLKLVEDKVPFMNGGLFECLDKPDPQMKGRQGGDVILYEDGFSDRSDNLLRVPDYIFFDGDQHADLSDELGDQRQKNVTVKGLINILKAYKFTVTENTPIEEDIALDPELLGQVFENLLASYNPETKTTARKQTGSFYTPREIVDYMVDESLIAYFSTHLNGVQRALPVVPTATGEARCTPDKLRALLSYNDLPTPFNETETTRLINAIDNCKILDPACGSGAFPMGILHKLVHCLHKLDPDNNQWQALQRAKILQDTQAAMSIEDNKALSKKLKELKELKELNDTFDHNVNHPDYARKLFLIENCIYGLDIQPIAIQISKLRFFISLVVDQIVNSDKDDFGILPLPNLETKFVAANTLIGIDKPKTGINADSTRSLFDNTEIEVLEKQLKNVRHRLFSAKTQATKNKYREEDRALREKIGNLLTDTGWDNNTARQLAAWDPYDQNIGSPFFDAEWMFGLSNGFDIVIGNPPYIGAIALAKDLRDILNHSTYYTTLYQKWDVYIAFIEKGIRLSKGGITCMIVPYPILNQTYAKKLREFILKQNNLLEITNLSGNKIFEEATVTNCILFVKNSDSYGNKNIHLSKLNDNKISVVDNILKTDLVTDEKTFIWHLSKKKTLSFNGDNFKNLGDYCFISIGMVLNADEKKAKGLFVKDELLSNSETEINCKKYTEAKYIEKYKIQKVLFLEWGTERVPSLIRRPTFPELYERPKLLVSKIGTIKATFDESNICCDQTIRILVLWKDLKSVKNKSIDNSVKKFQTNSRVALEEYSISISLKYLLALINSKLANYLLDQIRGTGNIDINPEYLKKIPIPKIPPEHQQHFI